MIVIKISLIIFLLFLSLIFSPDLSSGNSLLDRGIQHYRNENFEEALDIFLQAYKASPSTTLSFYIGLTYKQTGELRKAKEYFIESLTKTPKVFDSYVELIEILYSLDEIDEAKRWLMDAKEQKIMPAKIAYLEGLILLKENKNTEAIKAFEEAKTLDPQLKQPADVQISIALSRERKIGEAINLLKAIIELDPTSEIAEFSKDYMATLERLKEAYKEWRLSFSIGYLYDDNVVSKPSGTIGVQAIDEPSGKKDSAIFGNFKISYRPNLSGKILLSSDLNLYTKRYFDNKFYNTNTVTFTITPGYGFKNGVVTLPLELYYMTLNDEKYMAIYSLRPTLNLQLTDSTIFQLSAGYAKRDMLRYIIGADPKEDRDSDLYNLLAGIYLNFAEGKGLFWTRYDYQIDHTEGTNWKSDSHRIALGVLYNLVEKLNLIASADYTLQNFKKVSTLSGIGLPGFPDSPKKREDKTLNITAGLSYDLFRFMKLNLNYTHTRANSNFPIYDYKRNIYTFDLSLNF